MIETEIEVIRGLSSVTLMHKDFENSSQPFFSGEERIEANGSEYKKRKQSTTSITVMSTVRQYITLPRAYDLSPKATAYPLKTISNGSSNAQKPQFKVVLTSRKPSPSPKSKVAPCTIPSSEQFASELLQKIAKNPKTVNIQECTEQLIVSNITKKFRSRARFHRVQSSKSSTTMAPEVYAKMDNNEVVEKCKEFETIIQRQKAEIDDLRSRLFERKKLEEIWKETLTTMLAEYRTRCENHQTSTETLEEKLNVTAAKLKIITATSPSSDSLSSSLISPKGKFAKTLQRLAGNASESSLPLRKLKIKSRTGATEGEPCAKRGRISLSDSQKMRTYSSEDGSETSENSECRMSPDSGWNSGDSSDASMNSPPVSSSIDDFELDSGSIFTDVDRFVDIFSEIRDLEPTSIFSSDISDISSPWEASLASMSNSDLLHGSF
ncbi:Oidioi.mRNA.OKI2018_I69.XSR.g13551.t1.cds [Oikopleura dioica]|uniref:Oidioi.mRNA.OKI2018_I69.XSR.g13551.t1.cds n=1 Tax=Oikopleura dioica TaxID=34765 RepID=A0ABN7SBX2_OIKDI|nr:Oidioi.mRNA.OKI2018_I69.XSR.g13551.t1.cds [Oikopleura dioica]